MNRTVFALLAGFLVSLSPAFAQEENPLQTLTLTDVDTNWIRHYNSGLLPGKAQIAAMVTDEQGNVYCTGMIKNLLSGEDYMTIKYNASGLEQWKQIYNGPGNSFDAANCIVLDDQGNVYVSGGSQGDGTSRDYATIKYNTNGEVEWIARYDGPTSEAFDKAYAIAVDDAGNIYVTGGSDSYSSGDYATIKYDNSGTEQWVQRYDGTDDEGEDSAQLLALDRTGNIYISGKSKGNGTKDDYVTIKYNPDGDQQWLARYNGPDSQNDQPAAMAVDDSGNVYITGSSVDAKYKWNYATVKYDSSGTAQWSARYTGPAASNDNAKDLVVNDSGYVYVTGNSYDNTTGDDFTTIKYSTSGEEKWVARYTGTANGTDKATVICLDDDGNIYVGGQSAGSAIVKYNATGEELWHTNYPVAYEFIALNLDDAGNIYLSGNTNYLTFTGATVKFNSRGVLEWGVVQEGPGIGYEKPVEIALDSDENLYVAGFTNRPETSLDFSLIKYDPDGVEEWIALYNGPDSSSDQTMAMTVDASGNIYMTGRSNVYGSDTDWATVKFNNQGVLQWAARFDGGGNSDDTPTDISVDAQGNVYVAGYTIRTASSYYYDYATIKYSPSGTEEWVAFYDGPPSSSDLANALALDDSGNVYVTGASQGISSGDDITTVKYDPNGAEKWVARYNGPGNAGDLATNIALDGSGNVIVCGASKGDGSNYDYATIQYNASGTEQWAQRYNGTGNGWDWPTDLAVDKNGMIYVTGYAAGSYSEDDMVTLCYDQAGLQQWMSKYDGPAYSYDQAAALTLGPEGSVYVTGESRGLDDTYDYATHKINADGIREWAVRYNYKHDEAIDVIADDEGHIYVTGYTLFDYDTEARCTTIMYTDPTATGLSGDNVRLPLAFSLEQNYPNPFNPGTVIRYKLNVTSKIDLCIYNLLGQKVATLVSGYQPAGDYQVTWHASGLPSGVYMYRLETGDGFSQSKKLVLMK